MKKLTVACIFVLVLAVAAYAQMGGMGGMGGGMGGGMATGQGQPGQGQGMNMGTGQQMQMMCPKMGGQMPGMAGQGQMPGMQGMQMQQCGMMDRDMMQMMTDIMDNQEKIVMGLKPSEKENMLSSIRQLKQKMQGMMTTCQGTMGAPMAPPAPAPAPAPDGKEAPAKTEPMTH
ncbi:MAG TPA: hypothetical protein VK435_07210 [Thermodesulfovibrionales bacterium]|nr:hypothetical protein [Thermodesulfovibrionales bacterium]